MLRLVAASALLLVALMPGATGQLSGPDLSLTVEPPLAPIKPQIENPGFAATVVASCALVLQSQSPTSPQEGVVVAFEWHPTQGVVITGPAEARLDPALCAQATEVETSAAFQVSIARTAPGLVPLPIVGRATVGDKRSDAPFTVVADYYSVSEMKAESNLKKCSPCDRVPVEFEVTNLGNARTAYTFDTTTKPKGWSSTMPEPLLLDAGASGKAVAVVGGHGGEGAFGIRAIPSAADDPSKSGDPLVMNVLVRDTSLVSRATPGPAPLLAGLAALGVALSRRRA
jgi:hypothetical protein